MPEDLKDLMSIQAAVIVATLWMVGMTTVFDMGMEFVAHLVGAPF